MSRGPDAGTLLVRAIDRSARQAGCPITIVDSDWTRWASATFVGARHAISLSAADTSAFDTWLTALPDTELSLRGHLVADLLVIAVDRADACVTVQLEILTVED